MKRNYSVLLFGFVLACFLFAGFSLYAQDADSCGDLRKWADDNAEYYSKASRSEFVKLPYEKQLALYNEFSGEKIVSLWQYKAKAIENDASLSDAEKSELKKLFDFVRPCHFDTGDGKAEFNAFASGWADRMRKEYGWDEEKLFIYASSWLTSDEIKALEKK